MTPYSDTWECFLTRNMAYVLWRWQRLVGR